MTALVQTMFIAVALLLLLTPVGLILGSTLRLRRSENGRWWTLIGVSNLLLCVVTLDVAGTLVVGRFGGPEALARYALYSAYASNIVGYLALLTLGYAMHRIARETSA